jgi:hypothetical protein
MASSTIFYLNMAKGGRVVARIHPKKKASAGQVFDLLK